MFVYCCLFVSCFVFFTVQSVRSGRNHQEAHQPRYNPTTSAMMCILSSASHERPRTPRVLWPETRHLFWQSPGRFPALLVSTSGHAVLFAVPCSESVTGTCSRLQRQSDGRMYGVKGFLSSRISLCVRMKSRDSQYNNSFIPRESSTTSIAKQLLFASIKYLSDLVSDYFNVVSCFFCHWFQTFGSRCCTRETLMRGCCVCQPRGVTLWCVTAVSVNHAALHCDAWPLCLWITRSYTLLRDCCVWITRRYTMMRDCRVYESLGVTLWCVTISISHV